MLKLLQAALSANLMMRTDTLFVRARCQNLSGVLKERLTATLDMEFGHQRTVEGTVTRRRYTFDVLPLRTINEGQVFEFGIRYKGDLVWGGTYALRLGVQAGETVLLAPAEIGEIDVGFGWGIPTMRQQQRPVFRSFAPTPAAVPLPPSREPELLFTYMDGDRLVYDDAYEAAEQPDGWVIQTPRGAGFFLRRTVSGDTTAYTCEHVREDGPLLLEISFTLFRQRGGKAAVFQGGGREFDIGEAYPCGYEYSYDLRLATMAYDDRDVRVAELHCPDDRLYAGVTEEGFSARAILVHRVRRGSRTIPVRDPHTVTLIRVPIGEHGGWQTAAQALRRGLHPANIGLYQGAIYYMYLATQGPQPPAGSVTPFSPFPIKRLENVLTFKEIAQTIRDYHHFFGGIRQMPYIGGFQKGGFDSGFMRPYETDPRCGTAAELKALIEDAKEVGAVVGVHDNVDDNNVPGWGDGVECLDTDGTPWRGWFWAGGMTVNISPVKYLESGELHKKIDRMIETYGLHTSSHLDVLTSEPLRCDFDETHPTTATDNLRAKKQIVEAYGERGIAVTSETMIHAFAGLVNYAVCSREDRDSVYFGNDAYIPLCPLIYHGIFPYCGGSDDDLEMLWSILQGETAQIEYDHKSKETLDKIYVMNLPLHMLLDLPILYFEENGSRRRAVYGPDSYVEVDLEAVRYEIVRDGIAYARDFTSFVPCPDGYILYSRDGGEATCRLPEGWRGRQLSGVSLTFGGEGERVSVTAYGETVSARLQAGVPVKIRLKEE